LNKNSIIIIGVGEEKFINMNVLDSDDKLLSNGSKTAKRDIVQFVKFNDFKNNNSSLAEEVLRELPHQVVEFFLSQNHYPKKRNN
jgi:hypothetical protein